MTFSKKMIACCAAVVLAVTVLTGCASSQTAPVALVPQTANMIAEIQIGAIVNDPALIAAYNNSSHSANQPQTVQDALRYQQHQHQQHEERRFRLYGHYRPRDFQRENFCGKYRDKNREETGCQHI